MQTRNNRAPEIQTFTGKFVNFESPRPEMFDLVDIAHALALTNRYGGHTPFPYSVAQHSVLCSRMAPPGLEMQALMHDAQEAYVGDVPTTLKQMLPDYKVVEWKLEEVLRDKFGLPSELDPMVKTVDLRMLRTESEALGFTWWDRIPHDPYDLEIERWTWQQARDEFVNRFYDIKR